MVRCTHSQSAFCELSKLREIRQMMLFWFISSLSRISTTNFASRKWMLASAMSFDKFGDRNIWQSSHDDSTSCDRANCWFSSKLIQEPWGQNVLKTMNKRREKHLQNENQFQARSCWYFNALSCWHRRQLYGVQYDRMLFANCQNYVCYSRSDFVEITVAKESEC